MQIKKFPCLASAVSLFIAFTQIGIPCMGQTVHKNPDGTVEVTDDDTSYNPPAPVASSGRSSGGRSSKARSRSGSSGKIPAYTKRMGSVNVHRNADGTIEVTDMDMKTSWNGPGGGSSRRSGKSGRGASVGAYSKHHGDVSVKRNADGTVEVTDTSSSTRRKK